MKPLFRKNKNTEKHQRPFEVYLCLQAICMKWLSKRPHRVQSSKLSCFLGFSYQHGGVFHKALEKQSYSHFGCSSFDVFSACALFSALSHGDKWVGVLLVGDSSTQWELRAVTTSVCLRYELFVVLPTTNSFIITNKKYGREKKCFFSIVHHDTTSHLFWVLELVRYIRLFFNTNHFIS